MRVAGEIEWIYYEFIAHRQAPASTASACTHLEAYQDDIKQVAICRRWLGHNCRKNEEQYFDEVSDAALRTHFPPKCQYRDMTFTEKTVDQPQSVAGSVISTWRRQPGEQIVPTANTGDVQIEKGQVADAAACEVLCYEFVPGESEMNGGCLSFNYYANEDGNGGTCTLNNFMDGPAATHAFTASDAYLGTADPRAEYYEFVALSQEPYPDRAYPHEWNARCTHREP